MITTITVYKSEKYAINRKVLTDEQRAFFMQSFGCARKVYNLYVNDLYAFLEETHYEIGNPIPNDFKPKEVSAYKEDYPYLKSVDSLALANVKQNFTNAIKRFNTEYDHKSYTKRAIKRDKSGKEPLSFRGLKGMPKYKAKSRGDYSYRNGARENYGSLLP